MFVEEMIEHINHNLMIQRDGRYLELKCIECDETLDCELLDYDLWEKIIEGNGVRNECKSI